MKILGTQTPKFTSWHAKQGAGKNNGAYWYSKEIEEIILPEINANVVIITAGATLYKPWELPDHLIIVCHDNRTTRQSYGHLFNKKALWICSKESTVQTLSSYGEKGIYIPLSIDMEYVKQFKAKKTKNIAYVGNPWGFKRSYLNSLHKNIKQLNGLEREDLLREMAKYKSVIAEGRCLMEAQTLGAKGEVPKYENIEAVFVKPFDSRNALPHWEKALLSHRNTYSSATIIECMRSFNDLLTNKNRRVGEIFAVSNERALELLSNSVKLVEIV